MEIEHVMPARFYMMVDGIFRWVMQKDGESLIHCLYFLDWYREFQVWAAGFWTASGILKTFFSFYWLLKMLRPYWHPMLFDTSTQTSQMDVDEVPSRFQRPSR